MEPNMNNDPNDMFEETVDDIVLNTLIHNCFTSQKKCGLWPCYNKHSSKSKSPYGQTFQD